MTAQEAPRKKIKELEVMVAEAVVETPDTTTLVLFTGNDHLDYKAGNFLTIDPHQFEALERFVAFLEDLKGMKEPPRAYSLTSAPHERYLAITVKEERYASGVTKFPPLLSPMLVKRTTRGMRFTITGFTGPYTFPEDIELKTDHVVHICAGSGSVPNYSLLKHAIAHMPKIRHTFLYSNRTYDDIIFRDDLAKLESASGGRLRVVHMLTRDAEAARYGVNFRTGRVTPAALKEVIPDPSSCFAYVCGPAVTTHDRAAAAEKGITPSPRFFESVLNGLKELGVTPDRIKHETYG